jgi:hypothetical protein
MTFKYIAVSASVRTWGVGAVPPRRGYTPAPRPKPVEYSYISMTAQTLIEQIQ